MIAYFEDWAPLIYLLCFFAGLVLIASAGTYWLLFWLYGCNELCSMHCHDALWGP